MQELVLRVLMIGKILVRKVVLIEVFELVK